MSEANQALKINYFENLKKSFKTTLKNKYLWALGILAGSTTGLPSNSNYRFDDSGDVSNPFSSGQAGTEEMQEAWNKISSWATENANFLIVLGIIAAVIMILFFIISLISRGGLVYAHDRIAEGENTSFVSSFKYGRGKFWNILSLSVITFLLGLATIIILSAPALLLWGNKTILFGYIPFVVLLFFVIAVFIGATYEIALRYVILKDAKGVESFKSAFSLIMNHKKQTFFVWLAALIATMAGGFVLVIALIIAALILVGVGGIMYLAGTVALILYITVAVILVITALLISAGILSSTISGYWTLTFKEIQNQLSK